MQVRGLDVAGIVEDVGAGVTDFAAGDAVFGSCLGSLAEFTGARAERLAPKPERLSFEEAAGIAVAGCMALEGVRDHAQLRAGQRIAITGATGGVGSFAVQIAKAYGSHVTSARCGRRTRAARAAAPDRSPPRTRCRCPITGRDA